jgi:nicotinamidase-related amidase
MPTTLDPSTALVLVDLQHGITALPTIAPAPPIVERCARLAAAFRGGGKVVAATRVVFSADGGDVVRTRTAEPPPAITPASDWGEFHAELALDERDLRITKRGWDPFYGTELDLQLRRRRVTGIVLGGIATSVGVESAARSAHERGYELTVVTDAVTDVVSEAHDNSLRVILPRIAELASTEEVLTALQAAG